MQDQRDSFLSEIASRLPQAPKMKDDDNNSVLCAIIYGASIVSAAALISFGLVNICSGTAMVGSTETAFSFGKCEILMRAQSSLLFKDSSQ
jgi:hypothetical protein